MTRERWVAVALWLSFGGYVALLWLGRDHYLAADRPDLAFPALVLLGLVGMGVIAITLDAFFG